MKIIFWILWILDLLLLMLTIAGSRWRAGFGAGTDFNQILIAVLVVILIGSMGIRISGKLNWLSQMLVGLPLAAMIILYFLKK